ncbi:unnamed protein product [Clonostachys byssicola]|uniref:Uncharacterized protein n=1 Tax=Clonostachys byssicola TaxID=160290 RepID=A0A9N9XZ73_9HYPO|nr:unnamed protein product [Clonostachys byssicola]
MADGGPQKPGGDEPFCTNCGVVGHLPTIYCPSKRRERTAGSEAQLSSAQDAQRSGRDRNRGGRKRYAPPVINRYTRPGTQDTSSFPPPVFNQAHPASYGAQQPPFVPTPPPSFNPYHPQSQYPAGQYPLEYPNVFPAPHPPQSYGPPPAGPQLTDMPGNLPPGPPLGPPPPPLQVHQGGFQPQTPAPLYSQVPGSYPAPQPVYSGPPGSYPAPQSVHSGPPDMTRASRRFGPPSKQKNVSGTSDKRQSSGGSNPEKQSNQAPQSKPPTTPTEPSEEIDYSLPQKPVTKLPPPYQHPAHLVNQNRLDKRRNQRSQKQQERSLSNRDKGNQNGGANNRRNSSHRKQNTSNKSDSPRFRKRSRDGAPVEDAKSAPKTQSSPSRLEEDVESNETSTPLKTSESELPTEVGSSNLEATKLHDQEESNVADQPKENSDDVKDASLNSDGGDTNKLTHDDSATDVVSKDIERADTAENDSPINTEAKLSADEPDVKQQCSEEANLKTSVDAGEPSDRQEIGRKRRHTDEEDDSQDRLYKRRKSSETEGQPTESLQVNEGENGPHSSEHISLAAPLEEQLPTNRRDSILSNESRPASRRSSISSRSSGLDSLELELLGLPVKGESKTEKSKKKSEGRGVVKKRQPVNSAYNRRW